MNSGCIVDDMNGVAEAATPGDLFCSSKRAAANWGVVVREVSSDNHMNMFGPVFFSVSDQKKTTLVTDPKSCTSISKTGSWFGTFFHSSIYWE